MRRLRFLLQLPLWFLLACVSMLILLCSSASEAMMWAYIKKQRVAADAAAAELEAATAAALDAAAAEAAAKAATEAAGAKAAHAAAVEAAQAAGEPAPSAPLERSVSQVREHLPAVLSSHTNLPLSWYGPLTQRLAGG